jgi:hypothetical protein
MSVPITPQRVRWAINGTKKTIGVDVLTSETARVLKPADLQFEIGLFNDDGETLLELDGLASLTLAIKPYDQRTAAAVMTQTLLAAGLNDELSQNQWEAGDPEDCHALFSFPAADCNFYLGEETKRFYVVLSGTTDSDPAKPLVFANGQIIFEESGVALP